MNLQNEFVHHSGNCEFCPATANCGGIASFELSQKPRCIKGCCFGEIRFREFPLPLHFRCIWMYTYTKMCKIFTCFFEVREICFKMYSWVFYNSSDTAWRSQFFWNRKQPHLGTCISWQIPMLPARRPKVPTTLERPWPIWCLGFWS